MEEWSTPADTQSVLSIEATGFAAEPAPQDESGDGVRLETTRGPIHCLLHRATSLTDTAVIWVAGGRGGFLGPADGIYSPLAHELAPLGITSLRLAYRRPANLDESVLDVLVGVSYLESLNVRRVALVGHSFGGGVVLSAQRYSRRVAAVAALASQTIGAEDVVLLAPRPLLLVHGEADTVLPAENTEQIYQWAFDPKQKVIYPGAGHGLRECREELRHLLREWLLQHLSGR